MKRFLFFLLAIFCGMAQMQARTILHPGGMLSNDDIARIKSHVDAMDEPWYSEWQKLLESSDCGINYTAKPTAEIGGSNGTRQRADADAKAAYYNAVIWRVTGDTRYADCAAKILSDWGATVQSAKDELYQFPCVSMAVAAEQLRNADGTFYEGWAEADRDTFLYKVRNVFVPACRTYCAYTNTLSSWYAPAAAAILAAGIALDDVDIYEEGLALYRSETGTGGVYQSILENGQLVEMGRDHVHANLTLQALTQMAQEAWNQGDDLYGEGNNRLLKGYEYWCHYNLGYEDVNYEPFIRPWGERWFYISTNSNGFRTNPDGFAFERAYHHYRDVKKLDPSEYPYLTAYTKLARPQTRYYETLFFTDNTTSAPLFTSVPAQPTGLKATAGLDYIQLSWNHPADNDGKGFKVYRSTDGDNYYCIYTWNNYTRCQYRDTTCVNGIQYYYKVSQTNLAGESELSNVASALSNSGTVNALPEGWLTKAIGSASSESFTTYSTANQGTFALTGNGSDISGTSDDYYFCYIPLNGNITLTARVTSTEEAFRKIGLMIRSAVSGSSSRVAITLGDNGCRYCKMATRTNAGDNTTWVEGCQNTYAPMWMRITRQGNTFSTYQSRDGIRFSLIATSTVSMPDRVFAGFGIANNATSLYQVVFDHVTITDDNHQAPATPANFKATAENSSRVNLSWETDENADSYMISRSTEENGTYTVIAEQCEGNIFTDSCLTANTTYYYQIMAHNIAGNSSIASTYITTPALSAPATPTQVKAFWKSDKEVLLKWNATERAKEYLISRTTTADGTYTQIGTTTEPAYTDNSVAGTSEGYTYYYQVKALNEAGQSEASTAVAATVYTLSKVTGTTIGTDGSYGGKGNTKEKAVDGDLNSYYDAYNASGDWVGINCGNNYKAMVVQIRFTPRQGYGSRMIGGKFEASNSADFSDATVLGMVGDTPEEGVLNVMNVVNANSYRYFRYIGPDNASCNVAEVQFYGHTIALQSQTITFAAIPTKTTADADFDPEATASSGLPITYTSSKEEVATIVDGKVHIVGVGSSFIKANQAGNEYYSAAPQYSRKLTVTLATGIDVVQSTDAANHDIYDLTGRKVKLNTTSTEGLKKGVYCIDHKKQVVR